MAAGTARKQLIQERVRKLRENTDFVMAIKKDGSKQKTKQASSKTEESPTTEQVRKITSPGQKGKADFPIVGIGSSAGGLVIIAPSSLSVADWR